MQHKKDTQQRLKFSFTIQNTVMCSVLEHATNIIRCVAEGNNKTRRVFAFRGVCCNK